MSEAAATRASGTLLGRPLTVSLLLAGPYLTVMLVLSQAGGAWLPGDQVRMVLVVALLLWSPLLFSLPALLLQDARDEALPKMQSWWSSIVRGALLVPYLLLSPRSGVRVEMVANLVGLLVALLVALPYLF